MKNLQKIILGIAIGGALSLVHLRSKQLEATTLESINEFFTEDISLMRNLFGDFKLAYVDITGDKRQEVLLIFKGDNFFYKDSRTLNPYFRRISYETLQQKNITY